MKSFAARKQNDGRERAVEWANRQGYNARDLERLNEAFDPNCISFAK